MSGSLFTRGSGEVPEGEGPTGDAMAQLGVVAARPTHRAILTCLWLHGDLDLHDLATRVVSRRRGVPVADVPAERRQRLIADLHHRYLPRLAAVDLVERDGDAVSPSIGARSPIGRLMPLDAGSGADGTWEAVAALLAEDCRRRIVAALDDAEGALAVRPLAEILAAAERSDGPTTDDPVWSLAVALHHVHLPRLADVGVIEYDPDARAAELAWLPDAYRTVLAAAGRRSDGLAQ